MSIFTKDAQMELRNDADTGIIGGYKKREKGGNSKCS
jgi:hypothetical protein